MGFGPGKFSQTTWREGNDSILWSCLLQALSQENPSVNSRLSVSECFSTESHRGLLMLDLSHLPAAPECQARAGSAWEHSPPQAACAWQRAELDPRGCPGTPTCCSWGSGDTWATLCRAAGGDRCWQTCTHGSATGTALGTDRLLGSTGLYWVLLGHAGWCWVILGYMGLYWVVLDCAGPCGVMQHCAGLYWVIWGYTGLFWVMWGCAGFCWVILDHTGLYWVILGCAASYWVHCVILSGAAGLGL